MANINSGERLAPSLPHLLVNSLNASIPPTVPPFSPRIRQMMVMARVDGGLRVERQLLNLRDILYLYLHLRKLVPTPIPKSFEKRVVYWFSPVFQYIDNIGAWGSELIGSQ